MILDVNMMLIGGFGFLMAFVTFRYNVAPQGFLGSGDHYVAQYNAVMGKLLQEEKKDPDSVFKCFSDKTEGANWHMPAWRRCIDDTLIWSNSIENSFLQCARYLQFCGTEGIIFNPRKLEVGKKNVDIFGFRMSQNGVLPSLNQVESLAKYPNPRNLRDMRGFMGLLNQTTFCLSNESRKLMEKLKGTLKSTRQWAWSKSNQVDFEALKKKVVIDCEKGIKRLTSHGDTPLVMLSDWSKAGSGYTLYEVTCGHPDSWDVRNDKIKTLCCPDKWRLIMAGGRFNSDTEAGYAPVEGELLGIASALHKSRYFVSGHPNLTIVTDHKPLLNLLQDRSRIINNKRLTNLRRKCDGFLFKIGYGKGVDNTTDAISRIQDWSKEDPDRLAPVEDSIDIDDDSPEVHATELINKTDLEEVMAEVNSLDNSSRLYNHDVSNAILGSWFTTPKHQQLNLLLKMYGNSRPNADDRIFSTSIEEIDKDRTTYYESKLDVANDLDNVSNDQHEVCAENGYGHSSEAELGTGPERYQAECFVLNVNKRKFYSLSWEEIEEAANNDEYLVKLKKAMLSDDNDTMEELIKNKRIHCAQNKNGIAKIQVADLSIYKNIIMVRDRIWAPEPITFAFFNNLHLGHRSVDMMHRLALRSVYWPGMRKDLETFFSECQHCNRIMKRNKKPDDIPDEETTRPYECISMDGFHTDAGENGIAIIDKHTGYIWAEKTGDKETGTARKVLEILLKCIGPAIYLVKKFKTDNGKNLIGGIIEEISRDLKIWQDTSSAYHPAGNKCIENAVQRIKHAIGNRKMEDCTMDIIALNMSQPYNNKTLTPFEELHGLTSPVNGIPMKDSSIIELVERKYLSDKLQRAEVRNSNPTLKPFSKIDTHPQTRGENELSKDWVEKINGKYDENLTCGDRVYYVDHQANDSNRWRKGLILKRKQDYKMSSGIYKAHGYDIYDIENCTTVSRTRHDIRKFKHTKVERHILERANKHLAEMRREFLKSDFIHAEKPAEFTMEDYDKAVKESKHPQPETITRPSTPPELPATPNIKKEVKIEEPKQKETSPETQTNPEQTPQEAPKPSMEERRLKTGLDGGYWQCNQEHGRRLRIRTTDLQEEENLEDAQEDTPNIEQKEGDYPK